MYEPIKPDSNSCPVIYFYIRQDYRSLGNFYHRTKLYMNYYDYLLIILK